MKNVATEITHFGTTADIQKGRQILSSGDVLGSYLIERLLGRGGMGEVYYGVHRQFHIGRAIKILRPEIAARNPLFAERFLQEARLASRLQHENIINVIDVGYSKERKLHYIIMEYVEGETIRHILKNSGCFKERQALKIMVCLCDVLRKIESLGMVHRDIKPENIMVTRDGTVKLVDFGIAKTVHDRADSNLTMQNTLFGTPSYISPEQAHDAHNVDIRADIYSLGAVFYEMLTGEKCFKGENTIEILEKVFAGNITDIRVYNSKVSESVVSLINRMLSREREKRPANADVLYKAVSHLLDAKQKHRELLLNRISDLMYLRIMAVPLTCKRIGLAVLESKHTLPVLVVTLLLVGSACMILNGTVTLFPERPVEPGEPIPWAVGSQSFCVIKIKAEPYVLKCLEKNRNTLQMFFEGKWIHLTNQLSRACRVELPKDISELRFRINQCNELRSVPIKLISGKAVAITLPVELLPGTLEINCSVPFFEVWHDYQWQRTKTVKIPAEQTNELLVRADNFLINKLSDIRLLPGETQTVVVSLVPGYVSVPSVNPDIVEGIKAFRLKNYAMAMRKLNDPSVSNSHAEAAYCLACMYEEGLATLLPDMDRAHTLFSLAAGQGHPGAMFKVANNFFAGLKTLQKDYKRAFYWYERGAFAGHPEATFRTGYMYEHGYGVIKNPQQALNYYHLAAELGQCEAMCALGRYYSLGANSVKIDKNKAYEWYERAANAGSQEARNILKAF